MPHATKLLLRGLGGGNLTFLPSPFQVPLCQASKSKRNIVNMGVNRGQTHYLLKININLNIYKSKNVLIH